MQKSLFKALEDYLELLYPDLVPHRVFALPAPSESAGAAELIEPSPPRVSQDIDQEQGRSTVMDSNFHDGLMSHTRTTIPFDCRC